MDNKTNIEKDNILWLWDIAKRLKYLANDIASWISDKLWIKVDTSQEVHELQQEIQSESIDKMNWWEKIWKFVMSKWMNPHKISARFGKNWENMDEDVVVNWPLFAPGWNPVWWYIQDWKTEKPFVTTINENQSGNFYKNNGIIWCDTNWKMHMFSYKDIAQQDGSTITKNDWEKISFKWAFQNGPMLVQDWELQTKNSNKKVDRTAIWFTSSWEIRAVQASSVSLWEFADFCKNQWLSNTMYLDWSSWIASLKDWRTWTLYWKWFAQWATWLQFW